MKKSPQVIAIAVGWACLLIAFAFDVPQPLRGTLMLFSLLCFGFSMGWILKDWKGGE